MDTVTYITDDPKNETIRNLSRDVVNDLGAVFTSPEVAEQGRITNSYRNIIAEASAVVAYLCEGKPNAIYEIGVAYGLEKPVIILTPDISNLPYDLRSFSFLRVSSEALDDSEGREQFRFKLQSQLLAALEGRLSEDTKTAQLSFEEASIEASRFDSPLSFSEIRKESGQERWSLFADWFKELASAVPEWKVSSKTPDDLGSNGTYDLAIWNHLSDPDLASLGNPIVVELKSAGRLPSRVILDIASRASSQNLKGVVIATTAAISDANRRAVEKAFWEQGVIVVLLGRQVLRIVEHSGDLLTAIKRSLHSFRST